MDKGDGERDFRKLKDLVWLSRGVSMQTRYRAILCKKSFLSEAEDASKALTHTECPSTDGWSVLIAVIFLSVVDCSSS